jgi:hypothetical protein
MSSAGVAARTEAGALAEGDADSTSEASRSHSGSVSSASVTIRSAISGSFAVDAVAI